MDKKETQKYGFNWGKYLSDQKGDAAPVQLFGHAQMSSNWVEIEAGVKVEVLNSDCPVSSKVYWIAQIMKVAGYKALLRYEGFGEDPCCDFWCNLCTDDVHAVGWCATVGKPLVPPRTIQFKYSNWKSFLIERLTGSKTLPNDFNERVTQSMECAFKPKMRVEVMDKTQISRKRIGIVEEIVGGRLRLQYEDSDEPNDDFWCHCSSFLIHPIGWSEKIGHRILVANKDYKFALGFKNSKPDMFVPVKTVKSCGFKVGMKLEAIDPLNLSSICVATIRKVLKNGFLMIGIDGSEAAGGTDWFCYHCSSPSIFPVGYCYSHNIILSIPNDYKNTFSWSEYLKHTKSEAAPSHLFLKDEVEHGFLKGMRLEAVDLMDPRMICVATVSRVVGRLLRVHFDGWDAEYDQWVDSQSPDIFPVGWCELFNYSIQPPPNYRNKTETPNENKRKAKNRNLPFTGKRKKKKVPDKKEMNTVMPTSRLDTCSEKQPVNKKVVEEEIDATSMSEPTQVSLQDTTVDSTMDMGINSDLGPPKEDGVFPLDDNAELDKDVLKDSETQKVSDNLNSSDELIPSKVSSHLNSPPVPNDSSPVRVSNNISPLKVSEDLSPMKLSDNLLPPKLSVDLSPVKVSDDLDMFEVSYEIDSSSITENPSNNSKVLTKNTEELDIAVEDVVTTQEDSEMEISQEIDLKLEEDSDDLTLANEAESSENLDPQISNLSNIENIPSTELNSHEHGSSKDQANSVEKLESASSIHNSDPLAEDILSLSPSLNSKDSCLPQDDETIPCVPTEENVVDNTIEL